MEKSEHSDLNLEEFSMKFTMRTGKGLRRWLLPTLSMRKGISKSYLVVKVGFRNLLKAEIDLDL